MSRACAVLLAAALGVAGLAGRAEATAYQYWSYWHGSAAGWVYSGAGPYYYRPADGSVEGWHYVVGSGGPGDPPPRAPASYPALCSTPASAPGVQVALVIDYGSSLARSCLTVPAGTSGSGVLQAAGAQVRYNASGLLCAINGVPPSGCGQVIGSPTPTPPPPPPPPSARPSARPSAAPPPAATGGPASPPRTPVVQRSGPAASRSAVGRPPTSAAARRPATATPLPGSAGPSFAPVAEPATPRGGAAVGLYLGLLLIAAVGGAAGWRLRRRS